MGRPAGRNEILCQKNVFHKRFPQFSLEKQKNKCYIITNRLFSLIVYCFCNLCRGELFRKDVKTASSGTTLTLTPDNRGGVVVTAKKAVCFGG